MWARLRLYLLALVFFTALVQPSSADHSAQTLPFAQDWTNIGLITVDDDWSGVPGITGYLGDYTTAMPTGVDPRTLLNDLGTTAVDVIASQTNPNLTTGGVAEFQLVANPTIALQGSGTADAPFVLISVDATGRSGLTVSYNLRDIDGSMDNAAQQLALHYRVGGSGNFTNVPAGYVADATTGPSQAWLETPVCVVLPPEADGQSLVQLRIMTTNAPGNDEWVGVDDISVVAGGSCGPVPPRAFGQATPAGVFRGASTLLTVVVVPGRNPDSTGLQVAGDLTAIGGSSTQTFFDNGTNGDAMANDRVFSYRATIPDDLTAVPSGRKSLPVIVTDAQLRTTTTAIPLAVGFDLPIYAIQGADARSLYEGEFVTTKGIVTARGFNRFFIQDSAGDDDLRTSDGIAVFRVGGSPFAPGSPVCVIGTVNEFVPDQGSAPVTEIGGNPIVTLASSAGPCTPPASIELPEPITLTATDPDPTGPPDQLERLEGMRVHVPSLTVVGPTLGNVSEPNAAATSNGVFYAVVSGVERPFREPGAGVSEPLPPDAPPSVPRFDENPERLRVDSDALTGATTLNLASGDVLTTCVPGEPVVPSVICLPGIPGIPGIPGFPGVIGVLDYAFRTYTILPDPPPPPLRPPVVTTRAAVPVHAPTPGQFTIASFNLQRLFDTIDDPAVDDVVMNVIGDPLGRRLNKLSLTIRNVLQSPDVIGVQEVENLTTLQALADRVNGDAGTPGDYIAYLVEGNDIGGIDVGFLVKSSRVQVVDVTQEGKDSQFLNPVTGQLETLNDRPPLVLRATIDNAAGATVPVTVIVNHLRSLTGINDPADGARVRAKRRAQAEFLANLIQARQTANPHERIISLGDYNAFEFSDGLVDVLGTVKGTPAPPDQVVLASDDLVDPDLTDLVETAVPPSERYSFIFDGHAQALDHVLVSAGLLALTDGLEYGRSNADFPEVLRGIVSLPQPPPAPPREVPERASDHDPLVAYFHFPAPTSTLLASSGSPSGFGRNVTFTATVTSAGEAVREGEVLFSADGTPLGTVPVDENGGATLTTASLALGTHSIAADYSGAATFNTSHASIEHVVLPTLSIDDLFFAEGDTGLTPAVFSLTLDPASDDEVTVRFATVDGTAAAGTDYAAVASLTVTFPPGTAMQQVTVPLVGETVFESDETFEVRLSDATGAMIVDAVGTGTVLNDDPMPRISVADASAREPDRGEATMTFSVRLSNPSAFPVRVRFFTLDGSATRGRDYEAAAGTVWFAPFETERTIDVTILADKPREKPQSFWVVLWGAEGGSIADRFGMGTILDARPKRRR